MGKGKSFVATKNQEQKIANGCACPNGCIKNEIIDETKPIPQGAVLLECSSAKCTMKKYLHAECFEKFEGEMIRILQTTFGSTRNWSAELCRRNMWHKSYHLIFKQCRCFCGGSLKLDDKDQGLKQPEKEKKKKSKPIKNLPDLGGSIFVTHKKAARRTTATYSTYCHQKDYNYVPSSIDEESYKFPLPVGMHRPVDISIKETKIKPKSLTQPLTSAATSDATKCTVSKVQKSHNPEPVEIKPIQNHCEFHIPAIVLKLADIEIYWSHIVKSIN